MKKSNIKIDACANKLVVSKAFYDRASAYGSAEYVELRKAMQDNPTAQIVFRTIKKKTYNGLTFEKMKDYIKTQPDSDKMLARFDEVLNIADSKNGLYPLTKKWFLETYPAYKESGVTENELAGVSVTMPEVIPLAS